MARKRKKQSVRGGAKASAAVRQGPEAREQEAMQALESGRWRDAIQGLKALLKDDAASARTPARRRALADAYAGRARELSGKGMLKEAAVIWENRAALGPEIPPSYEHGILRMRLGDPAPLLAAWSQPDTLARAQHQQVGEHLAAAVLAGDLDLLARLGHDDPLRRHAEPARAALEAYCGGDQAGLETALAQLPFRSPYRGWALLLKALVRAETEPEAAREMLARIDDASAFAPLRRAAEHALLPDAALLAKLRDIGPMQAALVAALRGWSQEQLELARALATLDDDTADPRQLRSVLQRYRDLLGADWVQRVSLRLMPLPPGPFARRPSSWSGLSELERALLEAWSAEAHGDPWDALESWERVATELSEEHRGRRPDAQRRLEIAMALRRADNYFKLLDTDRPEDYPDSPETLVADQLERSLQWDPEHRATSLRLIRWYRRARRLKDARRVLADASDRWPQDMGVLEAALETALASNAFKKAAGIARQMLAIDPINSSVRRRLVEAHVQHAAKQVPKARGDLARRELAEARTWTERGAGLEAIRHQLDLLDGLVVTALVDPDEGQSVLSELLARRGDGIDARVELMLAADRLALKQTDVAKRLGLEAPKVRHRDELLAIIAHLRGHLEHSQRLTVSLVEQLAATLKGAPWKQLERDDLELACETLRAYGLQEVRRDAARAGLKRWPRTPMLEYHEFESRYIDSGFPTAAELDKMERALARAQADGDMRAAERLRGLVRQFLPFGRMPGPSFIDDARDDPFPPGPEPADIGDLDDTFGLDLLLDALDQLPLNQALEAIGMSKSVAQQMLEIAREQGEQETIEMLKEMLRNAAGAAGGSPQSAPKPKPKSKSAGDGKPQSPSDPDDHDDPRQLDLF